MQSRQESAREWHSLPLWQFAAHSGGERNPIKPKRPSARTPESERARLKAYRSHGKGLEYAREQTRINNERASIARKCIRDGKPIPPDFPKWCHDVLSPEKKARAMAHTLRKNAMIKEAIESYREHGHFGEEAPAFAVTAASKYIKKCAVGAERDAGRAIASWFFKQVMGKAVKAHKSARNRVRCIFRANTRARYSATNSLGCSKVFLKEHLESMFEPWMTWDNYGSEWHIDHVVPLSFAGDDAESIKMLGNYQNLRPLCAKENVSKHDSVPDALTEWQAAAVKTILARRAEREAKG